MRIIGGKWKGRKLRFRANDTLRPTLGRTRETLFNWLRPHIKDTVCLDLFAGSGVLGFEALSQGAKEVIFVERHKPTMQGIRSIAGELQCEDRCRFLTRDARSVLRSDLEFDIVFIDPPFNDRQVLTDVLSLMTATANPRFQLAYVETPASEDPAQLAARCGLSLDKQTNAGGTVSCLLSP